MRYKQTKTKRYSNDNQMDHIYHKLQSLKMNKKSKNSDKITWNKTEKQRYTGFNWMNTDKQNIMKTSNLIEKKNHTGVKYYHPRQESIELQCLPLEMGEKLLEAYLD